VLAHDDEFMPVQHLQNLGDQLGRAVRLFARRDWQAQPLRFGEELLAMTVKHRIHLGPRRVNPRVHQAFAGGFVQTRHRQLARIAVGFEHFAQVTAQIDLYWTLLNRPPVVGGAR